MSTIASTNDSGQSGTAANCCDAGAASDAAAREVVRVAVEAAEAARQVAADAAAALGAVIKANFESGFDATSQSPTLDLGELEPQIQPNLASELDLEDLSVALRCMTELDVDGQFVDEVRTTFADCGIETDGDLRASKVGAVEKPNPGPASVVAQAADALIDTLEPLLLGEGEAYHAKTLLADLNDAQSRLAAGTMTADAALKRAEQWTELAARFVDDPAKGLSLQLKFAAQMLMGNVDWNSGLDLVSEVQKVSPSLPSNPTFMQSMNSPLNPINGAFQRLPNDGAEKVDVDDLWHMGKIQSFERPLTAEMSLEDQMSAARFNLLNKILNRPGTTEPLLSSVARDYSRVAAGLETGSMNHDEVAANVTKWVEMSELIIPYHQAEKDPKASGNSDEVHHLDQRPSNWDLEQANRARGYQEDMIESVLSQKVSWDEARPFVEEIKAFEPAEDPNQPGRYLPVSNEAHGDALHGGPLGPRRDYGFFDVHEVFDELRSAKTGGRPSRERFVFPDTFDAAARAMKWVSTSTRDVSSGWSQQTQGIGQSHGAQWGALPSTDEGQVSPPAVDDRPQQIAEFIKQLLKQRAIAAEDFVQQFLTFLAQSKAS
jgi:hypothetical protein